MAKKSKTTVIVVVLVILVLVAVAIAFFVHEGKGKGPIAHILHPDACPGGCGDHGKCDTSTKKCECDKGWIGTQCQQRFLECPANCSGHGSCAHSTGKCSCVHGYSGANCSLQQCPSSVAGKDCSGHGTCNHATGKCKCNFGFVSDDCEAAYTWVWDKVKGLCPGLTVIGIGEVVVEIVKDIATKKISFGEVEATIATLCAKKAKVEAIARGS